MSAGAKADLVRRLYELERSVLSAHDTVFARTPDWDNEANGCLRDLRLAAEMVGCLRRLTQAANISDIHRAFGAPGDFGYETPIGEALARLYSEATR